MGFDLLTRVVFLLAAESVRAPGRRETRGPEGTKREPRLAGKTGRTGQPLVLHPYLAPTPSCALP